MLRIIPFGAGILCAIAAATGYAETQAELFARFQEKIREDLAQVVNYTCTETIRRTEHPPGTREFRELDTVRLEISHVNGRELFAWPGARQFSDAEIKTFMEGGTTATGAFEAAAHEIFASGAATFHYEGETHRGGRDAVEYEFELPAEHGYKVNAAGVSGRVGMRGSFWFDPHSLDLIEIEQHGRAIPRGLALSDITVVISYARIPVSGTNALLPQRSAVELSSTNGSAGRNDTEFTKCHAYQTESTIRFDATPESIAEAAKLPAREARLPAGVLVPVVLETAVDFKTSAVGDPVTGKVKSDVKRNGEVVLPAGAVVSGRVRQLERRSFGQPYVVAGIELLTVEWAGKSADFYGELVDSDARRDVTAGYAMRGRATFILRGKQWRIAPGLGILWRVLDRPAESGK